MKKSKVQLSAILIIAFLTFYVLCVYIPFIWGFLASLKENNREIQNNLFGLPEVFHFDNYIKCFEILKISRDEVVDGLPVTYNLFLSDMLINSILYSVVAALSQSVCTYIMAYARGRYPFKFLGFIDVIVLVAMSLPIVGSLPSSIQLFKALGLFDTFIGMAVIAKFTFLGMHYFIVTSMIRGLPRAYIEAAEIDGANEFVIFAKILFPLTISTFLTIFLFDFIGKWNDFQTPYIFLKSYPTMAYALWHFKNAAKKETSEITYKLAASFLVALPVVVLFLFNHKRLMGGLSISEGVKE